VYIFLQNKKSKGETGDLWAQQQMKVVLYAVVLQDLLNVYSRQLFCRDKNFSSSVHAA